MAELPVPDSLIARQEAEYAPAGDRPLGGYTLIIGAYAVGMGVLGALARRRGLPRRVEPLDLLLLGVATHKSSRILTKDAATSPLRAPFTVYNGPGAPGEVNEEVRGTGLRHAVGELVTCPFCLSVWLATALAFGLVLAPRATRLVTAVLSAVSASDFLQLAYATLEKSASA